MTGRNIHGEWTMSFENRLLCSKINGATNKEAAQAWFNEMERALLTSENSDHLPWVALVDAREWKIASLDAWETNNELVDWMSSHNCVLFSFVLSKELQKFAIESQINNMSIMQTCFDYDEAHQNCLRKLAEAQRQQSK